MEMKHLPIILTAVLSLSCFDAKTLSAGEKEMEITSSGIENGRIEDKYGNLISTFQSQHRDALDEKTAYLMTNLLQGVVREGS